MSKNDNSNGIFSDSTKVNKGDASNPSPEAPLESAGGGSNPFAAPTRKGTVPGNVASPQSPDAVRPADIDLPTEHDNTPRNEGGTRLVRPKTNKGSFEGAGVVTVGWLVITGGGGKGSSMPLGYGLNSVGRGRDQAIQIDFQDEEISRSHCSVTYDPKGNQFYVNHAGGRNLTYLNDAPVLSAEKLTANDRITIGETELLFVPLCDDTFTWDEKSSDDN